MILMRPSGMVLMSAEVPPISTVIRLLRPHRMPSARPPITPPAGPDIRMPTAFCEQVSTVAMPPFDWMTRKLARKPFSVSRFCRLLR